MSPRQGEIGRFNRADGFHGNKSKPIAGGSTGRKSEGRKAENIDLNLPPAAKKRRGKEHHKRHVIRKTVSTFMIMILLGGGYLFGKGYASILSVFKGGGGAAALTQNVDPSQLRGEGDGRVNILLLGRGGAGHDGADLTDTMIVASIDPVNKKAALLSIPRDLFVQPDGYGGMKINAVFATGQNAAAENEDPVDAGMNLLENTLEETIGIPIHYHVLVDFQGFKQAVDTVGGVTIDVPEELSVYEYYPESGYVLDVKAGMQSFDGERALAFSRSRKTSTRGDFDRSERQRLMMIALKDKVFSLGTFGNPLKINQLLNNFGNHVTSNLTTNEMLRIYEIAQELPNDNIASVGLADEPNSLVTTGNYEGLSIVLPRAGMYEFDDIKSYVRNTLRDGYLTDEDATVAVYNGTQITGLASRTADELKSFGYNISTIDNAPQKGQMDTVIVDLTNGQKKYTRNYLEKRFGVTAVNSMPTTTIDPGEAEFVIILGTNEQNRLDQ